MLIPVKCLKIRLLVYNVIYIYEMFVMYILSLQSNYLFLNNIKMFIKCFIL